MDDKSHPDDKGPPSDDKGKSRPPTVFEYREDDVTDPLAPDAVTPQMVDML